MGRKGGGLPDLEFKAKTRSTPGSFPGDNTGDSAGHAPSSRLRKTTHSAASPELDSAGQSSDCSRSHTDTSGKTGPDRPGSSFSTENDTERGCMLPPGAAVQTLDVIFPAALMWRVFALRRGGLVNLDQESKKKGGGL